MSVHPPSQASRALPPPVRAPGLQAAPAVSRRAGTLVVGGMAALHLLALWALLQVPAVREAMQQVAPLMVDLVAPDPTPPSPPPPPPPSRPPPQPVIRPPLPTPPILAAPAAEPPPAEAFTAPPAPPAPEATPATAPVAAPPAPPAPPAAPPRRVIAASAVRYLVLPPVEVPRASKRAGEHGTVWLRVVVGTHGLPLQVSVQRSSGFARLDEQALWAMRQARFKPHTEDGHPIEVDVTAPIEYPED